MAVLAVLSLGATVFVAQRALSDARDVVVRGEADSLLSAVASDLAEETTPPTRALLEKELETHAAQGLRYVALVDREGRALAEAGRAEMSGAPGRPGLAMIGDRRVRAMGPMGPPHRGVRHEGRPPPMALLVVELEPPVMDQLRAHLTRISVVAAVAGVILLAFAVAWSRSAARLAVIERKAAREQRLVALGSMSSVMAHELRNPLASLKGHAQLLAEDLEGDPKKKAKVDRVVGEAERLEVLTTSLLDFVRDGPIERTSVAPAELVDRALADLANDRARVAIDVERAPKELFVDPQRLARAVHNVVDNALQAKADADVTLSVAEESGDVVIAIRDHGPGLPEDMQIFEPFVTTRTKGTGLGLAVARRIAEQHDGSLVGENHPAGGALFRLRFPSARS
jgi:two-component system, NtrC family, sensor histidine kinase HydH